MLNDSRNNNSYEHVLLKVFWRSKQQGTDLSRLSSIEEETVPTKEGGRNGKLNA